MLSPPDCFSCERDKLRSLKTRVDHGAETGIDYSFCLGFAISRNDRDEISQTFIKATSGDAKVWLAYPKSSSRKLRCEFNRDQGWEILGEGGFEHVRQVAIDEDWSALRFRRFQFIRKLTRSSTMAISSEGKFRTSVRKNSGNRNAS